MVSSKVQNLLLGLGNVAKLYSLYEPSHSQATFHSIAKKPDPVLMQEGSGEEKIEAE